jgi:multidrug efflux pump subunit AcrB
MNLATWSIHNPIPCALLFIMMTLAGISGFRQLPIQNFPDLDLPTINVSLTLPGAAPAQLETEVARKVEDSLATLSGLKHIATAITDGQVSLTVEFVLEKRLSDALIEAKNAVDSVRSDLPVDLLQPTVSAVRVGADPLVTYAISSPNMSEEALSWFVDNKIGKMLLGTRGVGRFERVGGVTREVRITVDPEKMASLGVSATDISRALREVQMEESGGRAQIGGAEQSVRTVATVARAEDLASMQVALRDGRKVNLDQVATITDGIAERSQAALLDGKPTVGFRFYRAKGYDETQIVRDAGVALEALKKAHPDLVLKQVKSSVDYTLQQYEGSLHMLYEGAILAVIVVWFFLMDWRATLISAVALPLSIIPTFAFMHWLGYSLNTLTLLALAVVVGILVDDAIVEVENIVRHKQMGKPARAAAEEAVTEIALAVTATTLTLVVIFLPTSLMSGVPGLFFREFGWTIVISVLVSLAVARLVTPLMAVYFLKDDHTRTRPDGWIMTHYLRAVNWCIAHHKSTTVFAILFFAGSIFLMSTLPTGFLPASDRGYTTVSIELPPGSSLQQTLARAERARHAVAHVAGLDLVFTTVGDAQRAGGGATQAGEVRRGALSLAFAPRGSRRPQGEIEKDIRAALLTVPGARFTLSSGGPGEKMAILLSSENTAALTATARNLSQELRGIPYLSNISTTASLERPEIVVRPDMARAAELGITSQTIGDTVRVATVGDFDAQLAKLNLDNRQVYIRVRMADAARQDTDTLANLRLPTLHGMTTLANVADISTSTGPSQIDRYDRKRYVTVNADLGGAPLGKALADAKALPAITSMPSSVKLIQTGDAEIMAELFAGFGGAMLTGVLCVFCVLVLLFKDFFQPVTILSALPLSIGGAVVALMLTREQMGLPALIGIVMLMGIVTKNSILLVEYTIVGMRERGFNRHDAIIDACHKRARPIVMTTIAMIAGMLPIALGFGGDASFRQPMAIAVIGGLITSTALSLLVVPVTFTYVDTTESWLRRLFLKRFGHPAEPAAPLPDQPA